MFDRVLKTRNGARRTFKTAGRVCPVGNRGSARRAPVETDECLSAVERADEGPPSLLFIPKQFIFFNRAISLPPLCPRLCNKYVPFVPLPTTK